MKYDVASGVNLLRRVGSNPIYEQIIGKYREEQDVTRHAGAGRRRVMIKMEPLLSWRRLSLIIKQ